MSYADDVFIKMCQDILENGTSTEGEKVRPVWEDGTPAYTIKKFGVVNRYDLRKEFPAMTLRRTALRSAMDEILCAVEEARGERFFMRSELFDAGLLYPAQRRLPAVNAGQVQCAGFKAVRHPVGQLLGVRRAARASRYKRRQALCQLRREQQRADNIPLKKERA